MPGLDSFSEKPLLQHLSDRISHYNLRTRGPDLIRKHAKLLIIAAAIIFVILCRNIIIGSVSNVASLPGLKATAKGNPVYNSTLGFEKIYALVLPSRSDRRGPLIGTGNATNLDLTVLDAVLDKEIPADDIPPTWGVGDHDADPGELGCLMSHMKTWQKMVDEDIGSALIVESDADWDMRIKESMDGLSSAVRTLADYPFTPYIHQPLSPSPKPSSTPPPSLEPYGDKWDVLWIGHCGARADGNGRFYAYNDSSAAPPGHDWTFSDPNTAPSDAYSRPGNTRLVFEFNEVVCTTGYAISNRGARKFVEKSKQVNAPVDLHMRGHCVGDPDLICLTAYPQIISLSLSKSNIHHEDPGENQGVGDVEKDVKVNAGLGLQISARLNGHLGLASQGPEKWKKEWEDEVVEAEEDTLVLGKR